MKTWSRQSLPVKIAIGLCLVLLGGTLLYSCARDDDTVVENPDSTVLKPLQVYVVDPDTGQAQVRSGELDELVSQYKRLTAGIEPEQIQGQKVYYRLNPDGTKIAVLTTERDNLLVVGFKRYGAGNSLEAFRYFAIPREAVE